MKEIDLIIIAIAMFIIIMIFDLIGYLIRDIVKDPDRKPPYITDLIGHFIRHKPEEQDKKPLSKEQE